LQACHFNLTIELSLSALNRGYKIAQVPIQWHGRCWGSSKLKLREMGRRYLATLVKMYAERVLTHDDLMADLERLRLEQHPTVSKEEYLGDRARTSTDKQTDCRGPQIRPAKAAG
jgi:dolichol-phosphate mannosyltransferase